MCWGGECVLPTDRKNQSSSVCSTWPLRGLRFYGFMVPTICEQSNIEIKCDLIQMFLWRTNQANSINWKIRKTWFPEFIKTKHLGFFLGVDGGHKNNAHTHIYIQNSISTHLFISLFIYIHLYISFAEGVRNWNKTGI